MLRHLFSGIMFDQPFPNAAHKRFGNRYVSQNVNCFDAQWSQAGQIHAHAQKGLLTANLTLQPSDVASARRREYFITRGHRTYED